MTKEECIKTVSDGTVPSTDFDKHLDQLKISLITFAYDAGFEEGLHKGMEVANDSQKLVSSLLRAKP